ncbi:FtsB family cell division protein [Ochrovirga pacifica]|uniref:FtsB family cell division protein n=1 Tax=Ochrovirga pacifica TaxID=1042376 RepID=UPI000255A82E|nr:septum formation initiator [Ochrovirga pacifica]
MSLKFIKNKKTWGRLVIAFFVIWMLFFDANSYIYQQEYNSEINKLEQTIEFYETEIQKNKQTLHDFSIQKNLNNYAREKYHYKKEDEQLYLIEYDTLD